LLLNVGFPDHHIKAQQISEDAYLMALQVQATRRRERKTECMRASRKRRRAEIKRLFPEQTEGRGIIHRSLVPERNWVRGPGANFRLKRAAFQAVFDLFCWKYYLWAMNRS
jgi:hypothetical protein